MMINQAYNIYIHLKIYNKYTISKKLKIKDKPFSSVIIPYILNNRARI
jgi:hypothetical protein